MNLSPEARIAIALGTIALGLGLYVAVLEPRSVSSDVENSRKGRLFSEVSPHEVKKIDIDVDGVAMQLDRTSSGWSSKETIDPACVDKLVNIIDKEVPVRLVEASELGRIRARYKLSFASRSHVLSVGRETDVPMGGAYVTLDDRAMVVSRALALVLLQSPLTLLDTTIWKLAPSALVSLSVGSGSSTRRFVLRDGGLIASDGARVSRKAVDNLFSLLLSLRVERFLAPNVIRETPFSPCSKRKAAREKLRSVGRVSLAAPIAWRVYREDGTHASPGPWHRRWSHCCKHGPTWRSFRRIAMKWNASRSARADGFSRRHAKRAGFT